MPRRPLADRAAALVIWAPAALAAIYLLQLLRKLGTIRDSLASHADFASAPMIAELMSNRPDGAVIALGDYRWYEALWLLRATKFLPGHFTVWEFVPFVVWAIGIAAVVLAVSRVSTRWAAITAGAMVICGGLGMRTILWSLDAHGPAPVHAALLGLLVVLLAGARGRPRFRLWAAVSAPLAIGITAVGATDPLVFGVCIAPFALAALALAWRTHDWVAAAYGMVVAGGSAIGGVVLTKLGDRADMTYTHRPISFIGPDHLADQLGLLPGALSGLIARPVFGEQIAGATAFAMAGGLIGLAAFVVVVRLAIKTAWPQLAAGLGQPPATDEERTDAARLAFFVFWLSAIGFTIAQFVLTSAAFDVAGGRYLVTTWLAFGALLPVIAELKGQRVIGALAGASIAFVATALFIINPKPTRDEPFPTKAQVAEIEQWAKQQGVTTGYAGFWSAMPTTWQSRFGLKIYPIFPCQDPSRPERNCPMYQHQISSWYAPGERGRRMLILDDRLPLQPIKDPDFGKPITSRRFGSTVVYIYPADLTRAIG